MSKQTHIQYEKLQASLLKTLMKKHRMKLEQLLDSFLGDYSSFVTEFDGRSLPCSAEIFFNLIEYMYVEKGWVYCFSDNQAIQALTLRENDPAGVTITITPLGTRAKPRGRKTIRPTGILSLPKQVTHTSKQTPLPPTTPTLSTAPTLSIVESIADLLATRPYDYPPIQDFTEVVARTEIYKAIQGRRGQQAFREKLLIAYQRQCAITRSTIESLLEAAHIRPYCGGGTFDETNGLLLRADIHTLFDLGLIAINSCDMTVITHAVLDNTEYANYANQKINLPLDPQHRPDKEALDIHCKEAGLSECMKDDCKKIIELVDRTLEQIQVISPTDSL